MDPVNDALAKALAKSLGSGARELSELLADKIRYLRWKSAVRTLERAKSFAEPYGGLGSVPPLKFFLPFMENCSLEEDDEGAVDTWAGLLVSASRSFDPTHLLFSRLIREMTGSEVRCLDLVANPHGYTGLTREDFEAWLAQTDRIIDLGMNSIHHHPNISPDGGTFVDLDWAVGCYRQINNLWRIGFIVDALEFQGNDKHRSLRDVSFLAHVHPILDRIEPVSLEILCALGLVEKKKVVRTEAGWRTKGTVYRLTVLGLEFICACSLPISLPSENKAH